MGVPVLAEIRLEEPGRGDAQLRHDATFTAWDDAFSTMRDVVNRGIDAVNEAGAGLRRLPEGSLEELLILPLTGDYPAIRQNAAACHDVRDALGTWSDNVLRLGLATEPDWGGRAAAAYLLRLGALGLAARGAGEVVARGSVVLDEVARVSEAVGIRVEKLVVELGKTLVRLARRILSKVGGPVGWGVFALEVLTQGLDAITDIIDDVRRVLELVDTLRELHATVSDWVGEQRERLELFAELPALLRP
ncbi:hypothetical protein [Nocardioides dongkuii]|uniref:hypothetical protein n=1 Tax=Nocardioides dongkuii TaxID=2760089 RepID=UPI0015F99D17|nr:hypothetical protein [Nocardioides dongkuii]